MPSAVAIFSLLLQFSVLFHHAYFVRPMDTGSCLFDAQKPDYSSETHLKVAILHLVSIHKPTDKPDINPEGTSS